MKGLARGRDDHGCGHPRNGVCYEVADRVVFMDEGRIVEDGAPNQLFAAPVEERTKAFLRQIL